MCSSDLLVLPILFALRTVFFVHLLPSRRWVLPSHAVARDFRVQHHVCNYNRAIVTYHTALSQVRMPFFLRFSASRAKKVTETSDFVSILANSGRVAPVQSRFWPGRTNARPGRSQPAQRSPRPIRGERPVPAVPRDSCRLCSTKSTST